MRTEKQIEYNLKNMLKDKMYQGEYWRVYCEALADVLEIKINEI